MALLKHLARTTALAMLIALLAVTVVSADEDDEKEKGKKAPEVPVALIYPVLGGASYLVYRYVHSHRSSSMK